MEHIPFKEAIEVEPEKIPCEVQEVTNQAGPHLGDPGIPVDVIVVKEAVVEVMSSPKPSE